MGNRASKRKVGIMQELEEKLIAELSNNVRQQYEIQRSLKELEEKLSNNLEESITKEKIQESVEEMKTAIKQMLGDMSEKEFNEKFKKITDIFTKEMTEIENANKRMKALEKRVKAHLDCYVTTEQFMKEVGDIRNEFKQLVDNTVGYEDLEGLDDQIIKTMTNTIDERLPQGKIQMILNALDDQRQRTDRNEGQISMLQDKANDMHQLLDRQVEAAASHQRASEEIMKQQQVQVALTERRLDEQQAAHKSMVEEQQFTNRLMYRGIQEISKSVHAIGSQMTENNFQIPHQNPDMQRMTQDEEQQSHL